MVEISAEEVRRLPDGTFVTAREAWMDGEGRRRLAAGKTYIKIGRKLRKRWGLGKMPIKREGMAYWIRTEDAK